MAVTLDDGPDPDVTPRVLDALARSEARCTFFFLAERAQAWPHLVRRAADDGHEIALHGWDHRRVSTMPRREVEAYLVTARDALSQVLGRQVALYRPPYGSQSWTSFNAARRAGLDVVVWSHDVADWVDRHVDDVVSDALEVPAGGILLFHERLEPDPDHDDPVAGAPVTTFDRVAALERVHLGLSARGDQGCTVTDLGSFRRTAWFRP